MKQLSFAKVNRLRSGRTLFWVTAEINADLELVVNVHEKLLLGKKRTHYSIFQLLHDHPPLIGFTRKNGRDGKPETFWLPSGCGEFWFFASRRSAMEAAKQLREGRFPDLIAEMVAEKKQMVEAQERSEARSREWAEKANENPERQKPIRAFGESEMSSRYFRHN